MTRDEIMKLEGRELDAAVAELVMGWTLIEDTTYHSSGGAMVAIKNGGERVFLWHLRPFVYSEEKPWKPSEDIAAAWQVVDGFDHYTIGKTLDNKSDDEKYYCSVRSDSYHNKSVSGFCYAATQTIAICRAALMAVQ